MNQDIENENNDQLNGIAIVGMAGRFPMAESTDEFWDNLVNGKNCITFYEDEELIEAGINPDVLKHPDYVKAKGEVSNIDMFDAAFFGINPREAEVTDPQHRMLLECAWEAMEHAGYDSEKYDAPIGIFAGKSMDYYLLLNVYPHIRKEISAGSLQAAIGNDKDSLSTTISYRLNLTGPGITVQTSSSTSLVAVCVAAQSLLMYQCDIALAGGITAGPPQKSGYLYQEGGIWDPTGNCRAFDAKAKGFVPGSGMGIVVMKRLEDAVIENDTIWAVIRGFSVNNDGSKKVSYSAPSVDAQAEVVVEAQTMADVHPESISYIECHGTGTNLGDPIEITALTQAFRLSTDKKHFCAVGSAKSNIGHLDNAAGVAGLIKATMALYHKKIPPSLHFETPNPKIDFENSPFFVNHTLRDWDTGDTPRRAGVTSLGMGGTNAHVVLEEAPEPVPTTASRPWQVLLLSAQTTKALDTKCQQLSDHFRAKPGLDLADAAFTLQVGRRDFNRRRIVLCQDLEDACAKLDKPVPGRVADAICKTIERPVVFMFSGQGAQYVDMGKELYDTEPAFRDTIDQCAEILKPRLDMDIRDVIYPGPDADKEEKAGMLKQTWLTQPVLFTIEYALAQLWMEFGIQPTSMIGHSIGEWTAACVAGCISLQDALNLVVLRGRLMHRQDPGSMLSAGLDEAQITPLLSDVLSLAAVNAPGSCVVSGTHEAIEELEGKLAALYPNVFPKRLHTSHAFHSHMMEPMLEEFAKEVDKIDWQEPQIPFISGVTGTWITAGEAQSARYWTRQLRQAVRFSDGIKELLTDTNRVYLETGPGNSLTVLTNAHFQDPRGNNPVFSSMRHVKQNEPDAAVLLNTFGNLWLSGVPIDWDGFYKNETRVRVPLPTYPFEKKRYWLDEIKETRPARETVKTTAKETAAAPSVPNVAVQEPAKDEKSFDPRPEMEVEFAEPVDDLQRKIKSIWEDILGIRPVGIKDNFFDLGGHSLLATSFLSRVQTIFGVRLELRLIFEEPTVESISAMLQAELEKQGITYEAEEPEEAPEPVAQEAEATAADTSGRSFGDRPELDVEYAAPVNDLQREIVAIWEDMLGIRPIGIDDNFFDIGGHSLLATSFLSRIQEKHSVRLELRLIFEEPTASGIAALLAQELNIGDSGETAAETTGPAPVEHAISGAGVEDRYAAMTPAQPKESYPLSSAQKRFYMLQHMDLDSRAYNMTGLIKVEGKLEKDKFEDTLWKIINRHEALRTSIQLIDGEPRQIIHDTVDFAVDYHSSSADGAAAIIEGFIRPFDLTSAPLLRVGLIDLEDDGQVLMFDMHHIVSDGSSLSLLTKNLSAYYSGQDLPPLKLQYKDFCQWQNMLLAIGRLDNEKTYWQEALSGELPVLNLPVDFPRPEIQAFEGGSIEFQFGKELSTGVLQLMRTTHNTLYMMMLALYNVILGKYSQQEDIIVGSPLAVGRNNQDLEPSIGLLIETLVVRNFPKGDKTFHDFLMEVRTNTLNAFENQSFPFGEILDTVGVKTDRSRNPLFDAMLIVQNIEVGFKGAQIGDLKLTPYQAAAHDVSKTDINLEVEEKEGQLFFNLEYSTALFKKETMERFASFFEEVAQAVVANKDILLKDIKISLDLVTATSSLYEGGGSEFDF